VATHGFGNVRKIIQYKFLWLRLSDITQRFGNSKGFSYGSFFVICFCAQVLSSYGTLLGFSRQLELIHILLTSASLFLAVLLLCICTAAQEATKEVSKLPHALTSLLLPLLLPYAILPTALGPGVYSASNRN
jgi:hypothetical protein